MDCGYTYLGTPSRRYLLKRECMQNLKALLNTLDALSRFQILNGDKDKKIRIRIICRNSSDRLLSNYRAAIANYVREWNEDEYRRSILERIELEIVTMAVHNYKAEHVGWER
jgi:hypothetical protein